MALFVTNPMRTRTNGAKDRFIAHETGIPAGKLKRMKRHNYDEYQRLFRQAGGKSGLKGYRQRGAVARKRHKEIFAGVGDIMAAEDTMGYAMMGRRNPGLGHNRFTTRLLDNPGISSALDTATGAVASVPLVGDYVAPYVAPIAIGAGAAAVHYFAVKHLVQPFIIDNLPLSVQRYVDPVTYTLTGLAVGAGVQAVPLVSQSDKNIISAGVVTIGMAIDAWNFLTDRYGFGSEEAVMAAQAAESDVAGLGLQGLGLQGLGVQDLHGLGVQDLGGLYTDAHLGDAAYCGDDFDVAEGQALVQGPAAWCARFGVPSRARGSHSANGHSRHAGQHGHRWGWLIAMVGQEKARAIAAMKPAKRLKVLRDMKSRALSAANQAAAAAIADQGTLGDLPGGQSGPSGAMGAQGFGALIFAGQDV